MEFGHYFHLFPKMYHLSHNQLKTSHKEAKKSQNYLKNDSRISTKKTWNRSKFVPSWLKSSNTLNKSKLIYCGIYVYRTKW